MTETEFWFFFALTAFAAYCIVRHSAWRSYDKQRPAYRTADARKIDKQVRGLQAKVPAPLQPAAAAPKPPTAPAPPTPAAITASVREARQKQADHIKREAVQAALRDIGKRDKTPNRYPMGSRAYELWELHYNRVTKDAADAAAMTAASASHRVRSNSGKS